MRVLECSHVTVDPKDSKGAQRAPAAEGVVIAPPTLEPFGPLRRDQTIYRWDLDKTYLRTEFDTVRDLLRTAVESAAHKRTVPGAAALLRELRRTDPAGVFILSGSPTQMRRVLEAKLRLDGVQWDAFTLKPSLQNLLRGRVRFLRDQVGYKLSALLASRAQAAAQTEEILFGDDAEADAFIYSLYADICADRVSRETLLSVLEAARLYEEDIPDMVRFAERVPRGLTVRRIFIHLDRVSLPTAFAEFGPRVCAFYNYFQPALALVEEGAMEADAALRVGAEIVIHHAFSPDALTASFMDLVRRSYVGRSTAERIVETVAQTPPSRYAAAAPILAAFARELEARLPDLSDPAQLPQPELDYVALFARDRARAKAAKLRARLRKGLPWG